MAHETTDYERGFVDGYERGFKAGRDAHFPMTFPVAGAAIPAMTQPQIHYTDCGCPLNNVCMNAACPRRNVITSINTGAAVTG